MTRALAVLLIVLLASSCSSDGDAGRRYRAESDLWQADWEYKDLSIRPLQISDARWSGLAARYQSIARRCMSQPGTVARGAAQEQLHLLAARSLFSAVRIHAMMRDSIRVEQIYREMARDFEHLPQVAAEVALAQGRIAEDRGEPDTAANLYQSVIDRIGFLPDGTRTSSAVLGLPLRIARLRSRGASDAMAARHYALAQSFYGRILQDPAGDAVRLEAQARLAEIAADLGNAQEAIRSLRELESQLLALDNPPREPAEVRFAISGVQTGSGAAPESVRATLTSLLRDYPKSRVAPQALLALAANANQANRVDEALGFLDRIVADYGKDEEAVAGALLVRGRLLESRDRWPEALETFRRLPLGHPLSEAALWAPLEIAKHYDQVGDTGAVRTALGQAERAYRDFVAKYPPGPLSVFARERLVQVLALQQNYESAVTEAASLGEDLGATSKGAAFLILAADMARTGLADPARAAAILDRVGSLHAQADVGDWATAEAARLRGGAVP